MMKIPNWFFALFLSILFHAVVLFFISGKNHEPIVIAQAPVPIKIGFKAHSELKPYKRRIVPSARSSQVPRRQAPQQDGAKQNAEGPETKGAEELPTPTPHYSLIDSRESLLEPDGYVQPEYPRKARTLRQEGTMQIRIEVKDGVLVKNEVLASTGFPNLDEAALQAIRKWQFRSVSLVYIQKITFKLTI